MQTGTLFCPVRSSWQDLRTYLFAGLFVVGNLILPQVCHLIPSGGQMFLPIYFFTLIASYKFGLLVGVGTAILSPALNSALFGMPPAEALPVILMKSMLLAIVASYVAAQCKKLSLLYVAFVVVVYQIAGSAIEWQISQDWSAAMADLTRGLPGMLLQVFGGWWVLSKMALYEPH